MPLDDVEDDAEYENDAAYEDDAEYEEDPAWNNEWKDVIIQSSQSNLNSSMWSLASSSSVEKFDLRRGCVEVASYGRLPTEPTEKQTNPALTSPSDVAYIPQRHCFLVSEAFRNRIGIYEAETFKFIEWLAHPKCYKWFVRPTSLLSVARGHVFILVKDKIEILDHKLDGFQFKYGSFSGLAEGDSGEIFTLTCLRRNSAYFIQKLTLGPNNFYKFSGQIHLHVVDSFDNCKQSRPRFLTYSNNKLFITDSGLHKFYLVDLQTRTQQAFGYQGTQPGQLLQPSGILADHYGNLLIADGNRRLSVYSEAGQFVKVALEGDEDFVAVQNIRRFKDFLIVMKSSTKEKRCSGGVLWYQLPGPDSDSGLSSPASESCL